jgi:hypothetical protein
MAIKQVVKVRGSKVKLVLSVGKTIVRSFWNIQNIILIDLFNTNITTYTC